MPRKRTLKHSFQQLPPNTSQIYRQSAGAVVAAKQKVPAGAKRILPVMTRVQKPCCARVAEETQYEDDIVSHLSGYHSPSVSGSRFFAAPISEDPYRRHSHHSNTALRKQLAEEYNWLRKQVYELRKLSYESEREATGSRLFRHVLQMQQEKEEKIASTPQQQSRKKQRKGWAQEFNTRDFKRQ